VPRLAASWPLYINKLRAAVPSSRLATQQKKGKTQERMDRHQQNESNRPEEQRLLNRQDFDAIAKRFVSNATMIAYARIIGYFETFAVDVLHISKEEAEQYFTEGGPLPCTKMIRRFLFLLADGGRVVHGGQISRLTLINYATTFSGAIAYCNRKVDNCVSEQVYLCVKVNLTDELDLQRNTVLSKPIAYHQDVTVILAALFSPLGLRGFMSMRMVLNVALFINLMVDSCGRAHEVVASEKSPNQYLRWRHLEIWVFKLPD
jgi:hypothetical protein